MKSHLEVPQFTAARGLPPALRRLVTEFLDSIVQMVNANRPFLPLVREFAPAPGDEIVLADGDAGGPAALLTAELRREFPGTRVRWLAEDLHGTRRADLERLLGADADPVSLAELRAPPAAAGRRLLLSINALHTWPAPEARRRLAERAPLADVAIWGEGNNKSLRQVIGMTIIVPLVVLLRTPFIRPVRAERLLFTYLLPVLPLIIVWDGCAALFRIRGPDAARDLARAALPGTFAADAGKLPNNRGGFIIYLRVRRPG